MRCITLLTCIGILLMYPFPIVAQQKSNKEISAEKAEKLINWMKKNLSLSEHELDMTTGACSYYIPFIDSEMRKDEDEQTKMQAVRAIHQGMDESLKRNLTHAHYMQYLAHKKKMTKKDW